jgi:hypothetical protein
MNNIFNNEMPVRISIRTPGHRSADDSGQSEALPAIVQPVLRHRVAPGHYKLRPHNYLFLLAH